MDLIVTDKNLPGLSGLELAQQARRLDPGSRVILMTGYPSLVTAQQALELGLLDYLLKPFDDIREVRDEAARGPRASRPHPDGTGPGEPPRGRARGQPRHRAAAHRGTRPAGTGGAGVDGRARGAPSSAPRRATGGRGGELGAAQRLRTSGAGAGAEAGPGGALRGARRVPLPGDGAGGPARGRLRVPAQGPGREGARPRAAACWAAALPLPLGAGCGEVFPALTTASPQHHGPEHLHGEAPGAARSAQLTLAQYSMSSPP